MRIATWNVNSIRARVEQLAAWLDRCGPDVVLLQETRCATDELPGHELEARGYEVAHHGVDGRNGVAIVSRVGLSGVQLGFSGTNRPPYDEPRLVSATCGGLRVHSVYVPNGRTLDDPHYLFKLVWLERLRHDVDSTVPSVLGGDFNVAPADIDIYDPSRWRRRTHASPAERAAIDALGADGFVDVTREHHRGPGVYSWWGYRPGMFETNRGLRIDLLLASPDVAARTVDVSIDRWVRAGPRPSDHAPVVMTLDGAER